MVDRKFELTGKLGPEQLKRSLSVLIEAIENSKPINGPDSLDRQNRNEILDLLRSGNLSGKEAGAGYYQGFAVTEIEEALRRIKSGEHLAYLTYRHHWHKYPHTLQVSTFPVHLGVETSSICDLRCKMCFQNDPVFSDKPINFGLMNFDLYRKIIDEGAQKGLCSAKLSIRGEPILHPSLPEMIAYARKQGIIEISLNTNANRLDTKKSRAILAAEPHLVIFSVDADSKKLFESIRVGAVFENIIANVTRFHEIREKEFPASITKTRIQMTVVPEARREIEAVRQRWKQIADQIAVKEALIRQQSPCQVSAKTRPCRVLWQRLDVHFDGTVWLCDNDYHGRYCVGDVRRQTIYEIWHGEQMKQMRRHHAAGRKNAIEPCRHCEGL